MNILQALSILETQQLKEFLDVEIEKNRKVPAAGTYLIKHRIELKDPTPHRQKPVVAPEANGELKFYRIFFHFSLF